MCPMKWSSSFQSHPQFGQAMQYATGRPAWVLKATGVVATLVFAVPVIALALLVFAAALVTATAWIVFNLIAKLIEPFVGQSQSASNAASPHGDDGRENVRVIQRP